MNLTNTNLHYVGIVLLFVELLPSNTHFWGLGSIEGRQRSIGVWLTAENNKMYENLISIFNIVSVYQWLLTSVPKDWNLSESTFSQMLLKLPSLNWQNTAEG